MLKTITVLKKCKSLKKSVLSFLRKLTRDEISLMLDGNVFQARGPAMEKALSKPTFRELCRNASFFYAGSQVGINVDSTSIELCVICCSIALNSRKVTYNKVRAWHEIL